MPTQSRLSSAALSILAALFIAGCSSTATGPVNQQEPVEQNPEVVAPVEVVEEVISDFAEDNNTPVDGSGQPISRTFYFEYDKAILNPSDLAVLEVHAQIFDWVAYPFYLQVEDGVLTPTHDSFDSLVTVR